MRPPKVRFANLLRKIGKDLIARGDRIYVPPLPPPTEQEIVLRAWEAARGDKTLRLDYPLDSRSVVFDVGGFEGQWASDIFARYLCRVHVFEPMEEAARTIARRFAGNPHVALHQVALGARGGTADLTVDGDSSSLHLPGEKRVAVRVVTPEQVFAEQKVDAVTLMKLNIEGAEYDLLDHMIANGLISRIHNIQVQFHRWVPDAERRMERIQADLARTHRLTFQYRFIWESWENLSLGT
jgi:FkbM family methyltransferase